MTRVFNLLLRVLKGKVPLRALGYGFLNKWNFLTGSGNRRYELERLYLDHADPWDYNSSEYENRKYRATLEIVVEHCVNRRRALEVGCSVGVFTRLLAPHFEHVTSLDVSAEAVRIASSHPDRPANAIFRQDDVRHMATGDKYDVILFGEMLNYLRNEDFGVVCEKIDESLATDGVVVMVTGQIEWLENRLYCDQWDRGFSLRYNRVFKTWVDVPPRPYSVCVYRRKNS